MATSASAGGRAARAAADCEARAARPYEWIYLLRILGREFAVDTRQGTRLSLSPSAWAFLVSTAPGFDPDPGEGVGIAFGRAPSPEVLAELEAVRRGEKPHRPASEDPVPTLQTLTLNVAHACNLKCDYCFEDWPSLMEGFNRKGTGRMTQETARKAIDLLIHESKEMESLSVSFFGGEPLLNWPVVESTVAYCREAGAKAGKKFRFSITTNATRLTEEIEQFLLDNEFEVIISVDGAPQVNDRHRVFHSGRGSGEMVLDRARRFQEKVREAQAKGSTVLLSIRGTYFRNTMDFEESTFFLAEQGFDRISMENGVLRETHPASLRLSDVPELKERYNSFVKRMVDELVEGKTGFRHFHMTRRLETMGLKLPQKRECGAGSGYIAVSAGGKLYPCHKFVGAEEVLMGSVDEGVTDRDIGVTFWHTNVETKEQCARCWARYQCGGGCHADHHLIHGRFNRPDPVSCELLRHRVRLGYYMMARLEEEAPELLREIVPEAVTSGFCPMHREDVRATAKEDGVLLFHPGTRRVHELNSVSALIWQLCDGATRLDAINRRVSAAYNLPPEQTLDDTREAIEQLVRMELVA